MKLSERIARLESTLARGAVTADEFDSMVAAAVKDDSKQRRQNSARYAIRITNNTKGDYAQGTTTHYTDSLKEAEEIYTEWFEQDIASVTSVELIGATASSAIKEVRGNRLTTTFLQVDRRHQQ